MQSFTDLSGATFTVSYNANDQAVSSKDGTGATLSVTYDAAERPTTLTNGVAERTTIGYDAAGQPLSILDGAGNGQHFAWNADGFLQSATDALSHSANYTTDALGRIVSRTTPLNEKSSYTYDKLGRLVSTTSPLTQTTKLTYDPRGGLVRTDLPANVSASFARNDLGLISGVTDPNGGVWTLSDDPAGRLSAATDPLTRSAQVQYDSRSRPIGASNAAGSVKLSYDSLGNPVEAQFSDGTDLKYQYAPGRRLVSAADLTLAYDGDGRIVSSNGIAIARDGAGRVISITYTAGLTVTYKYNSVGDLIEVDDWVGGATTFQYDAAHQLTAANSPQRQLHEMLVRRQRTAQRQDLYQPGRDDLFVHRAARYGRKARICEPRHAAIGAAGRRPAFSYDAAHQISGATYDASGRVSRTTSAGEQDYVWNYGHARPVLAVVRSGGADLRYYVYLPNGGLMHSIEAADNSRHFYHFDETGSTAFLTDDTGSVSDAYGPRRSGNR